MYFFFRKFEETTHTQNFDIDIDFERVSIVCVLVRLTKKETRFVSLSVFVVLAMRFKNNSRIDEWIRTHRFAIPTISVFRVKFNVVEFARQAVNFSLEPAQATIIFKSKTFQKLIRNSSNDDGGKSNA